MLELISGKYVLEEFKLDNILPILTVKSAEHEDERLPVIILVHGLNSSKERNLAFAMHLANNGFLVILPDAYNHGDRGSSTFLKDLLTNTANTIVDVIMNTVEDIIRLIDYVCQEREDADCERIGMTGISLGGMITFASGMIERRIKVLVPIIASGDLATVASESSLINEIYNIHESSKKDVTFPLGFKNILSQIDPVMNPSGYFPRPLLMINGEKDTIFPIKAVHKTIQALKKAYSKNPELFKYVIVPNVEHVVTIDMIHTATDFFKKHFE